RTLSPEQCLVDLLRRIQSEPAPTLELDSSGATQKLVAKCLAKNASRRFQNCEHIIESIDAILPRFQIGTGTAARMSEEAKEQRNTFRELGGDAAGCLGEVGKGLVYLALFFICATLLIAGLWVVFRLLAD